MRAFRFILYPFALIYGSVLWCRNRLFDWGVLSTENVLAKVISIGNLSMGGTGKSPHVEWIADQLQSDHKVAILSRGYGRTSKGFVNVTKSSKSSTVGDEALYYKTRFGDKVNVAVDIDREELKEIAREQENVQKHTEGRTIVKEIVVPQKLVNIVAQ